MLVVANWKMNLRVADCGDYVSSLVSQLSAVKDTSVVICPPFTHLATLTQEIRKAGLSFLSCGAQNIHWLDSGAHTGEISPPMLSELGVRYAIVGHSERRAKYGESCANVALRTAAAVNAGIRPIVCVGEDEFITGSSGQKMATQEVLIELAQSLAGFPPQHLSMLAIAYEPTWAIGTGKAATPEIITEMHLQIRNTLLELFGVAAGSTIPILYGGSTSSQNAAEIMGCPNVGGVLVGNASLKPQGFADIVLAAQSS